MMVPLRGSTLAVGQPLPVLVAADSTALQRRFYAVLSQLGLVERLVFAGSLAQARACLEAVPPRLALVDPALSGGSGLELVREIRWADRQAAILVVSPWGTPEAVSGALGAGANGYVLRERDDLELTLSIRSVLRGGMPIDPCVARDALPPQDPVQRYQRNRPLALVR